MPMTIYKLFSAAAGDSVASLDIQLDGQIQAIHMSADAHGADALDDGCMAEVSFLSTNTFTSSDVRGSLMTVQTRLGLLTQGGGNMCVNAQVSSLEIPVNAGERVHMHVTLTGAPAGSKVHAYLYVADKGIGRLPGRRR